MPKLINLVGLTFGKLTVVGRGLHEKSGTIEWMCKCECGNKKVVPSGSLRKGKVKSCGCARLKGRRKDITGQRFGRLVILGFHSMAPNRTSKWNAQCDCGTEIVVRKTNLWIDKEGNVNTVSCGCHKVDLQRELKTIHGESAKKEYQCWHGIISRCTNKNSKNYKFYGGLGVSIHPDWLEYKNFLKDVGRAPPDRQYIDRINPFGNYEPENVRWTTLEVSLKNTRKNWKGDK